MLFALLMEYWEKITDASADSVDTKQKDTEYIYIYIWVV